jgi:hypothetical protein
MLPQLVVLAFNSPGRLILHDIDISILLHPMKAIPVVSLYADDVVMFCHPTRANIAAVRSILHLFGRASGRLVNYDKCSTTLLNCEPEDNVVITTSLGCQLAELPLTCLGIPLTLCRPTRGANVAIGEQNCGQASNLEV